MGRSRADLDAQGDKLEQRMRDRLPTKSARWDNRPKAVPDPDLEITGTERGGSGVQKIFRRFWVSVWSKNKGGRAPGPPRSATEKFLKRRSHFSNVFAAVAVVISESFAHR